MGKFYNHLVSFHKKFCWVFNNNFFESLDYLEKEMSLSWAELCPPLPTKSYPEVQPLVPQNVTVFGDRAFKEVIKLNEIILGSLI